MPFLVTTLSIPTKGLPFFVAMFLMASAIFFLSTWENNFPLIFVPAVSVKPLLPFPMVTPRALPITFPELSKITSVTILLSFLPCLPINLMTVSLGNAVVISSAVVLNGPAKNANFPTSPKITAGSPFNSNVFIIPFPTAVFPKSVSFNLSACA